MWIGGGKGIDIINFNTKKLSHLDASLGISDNNVEEIIEKQPGQVLLNTRKGINIICEDEGLIKEIGKAQGLHDDNMRALHKDKYNQVWAGTYDGGVEIISADEKMIKHIGREEGLSNEGVFSFSEDNDNRMWIATSGGGINVFDQAENVQRLNAGKSLHGKKFTSFAETNDMIWAGSDSGVNIIDKKNYAARFLNIKTYVSAILKDSRGRMWIGTFQNGVYIYDPNTNILKQFDTSSILNNHYIVGLYEDSQNRIWIGGTNLIVTNENIDEVNFINLGSFGKESITTGFREDQKGKIWFSQSGKGMGVLDMNAQTFRLSNDSLGLKTNNTAWLSAGINNDILSSTFDAGVMIINTQNETVTSITENEGLPDNVISSCVEKNKEYYISTSKNLTIITPPLINTSGTFWQMKTYGEADGTPILTAEAFQSMIARSGEIWQGTNGYINVMKARPVRALPASFITGIDIINKPQYFLDFDRRKSELERNDSLRNANDTLDSRQQIPESYAYFKTNKITWDSLSNHYNLPVNLSLPYYQNYFTFHYTSTSVTSSGQNSYRYILEGEDELWSDITQTLVSKTYINLSPGTYTFKVSTSTGDGK